MAFTPAFVESLEEGQVFVFGSNLVGCHSGGAALMALQRFGAVWGQSEGPQGQCYAIPVDVRGEAVDSVSSYMKRHIDKFLAYARQHEDVFFLVPRVGCGAAGFDDEFMAPFFKEALNMKNVSLPKRFVEVLERSVFEKRDDATQRIFNLIILDESGSMITIAKQAVSGLNETFQTIRNAQRDHKEQQHFISFVTFNSARIRTVMDCQAVDSDKELQWTDYQPDNCTPLFDAMARSINKLKDYVGDGDVVLVTIITDGYENASREYTGREIKKLVAELKEKGWVFAYIGTNQDVDAVADGLGIRSRMSYEYSDTGASEMFEKERRSKDLFFSRLSREGKMFLMKDDFDYFEEELHTPEKEAEEEPDRAWTPSSEDVDNVQKTDDNQQRQYSTYSGSDSEESPKNMRFWAKVKGAWKS